MRSRSAWVERHPGWTNWAAAGPHAMKDKQVAITPVEKSFLSMVFGIFETESYTNCRMAEASGSDTVSGIPGWLQALAVVASANGHAAKRSVRRDARHQASHHLGLFGLGFAENGR